jgi:hypothetical protein
MIPEVVDSGVLTRNFAEDFAAARELPAGA